MLDLPALPCQPAHPLIGQDLHAYGGCARLLLPFSLRSETAYKQSSRVSRPHSQTVQQESMAGHQVPLQGVEPAVPGANRTEVRWTGVQGSCRPACAGSTAAAAAE